MSSSTITKQIIASCTLIILLDKIKRQVKLLGTFLTVILDPHSSQRLLYMPLVAFMSTTDTWADQGTKHAFVIRQKMLKQKPYQTPVSNHASLDQVQHVQAQVIANSRSLSIGVHQATAALHVSCAIDKCGKPRPCCGAGGCKENTAAGCWP